MSRSGNLSLPMRTQSRNVGNTEPQRSGSHQALFPEMMTNFIKKYDKEPKGRCNTKYTIRSQIDWDGVLQILIAAQAARGDARSGVTRKLKKLKEKLNAHSTKVKKLVPLIPSNTYTSPVIIVLNVMFDAMKASNTVREELLKSLDSFRDSFEVIGTYFSIYHGFPEVSKAAISLGVAILKAIEEVIGYYLQHAVFKASEALWDGEDYKKSITTSLEDITMHGKRLHLEAQRANFKENHETHTGVIDANNGIKQVHNELSELHTRVNEMFLDYEYLKRRHDQEEALRYENMYLRVGNNSFRAITPPPQGLPLPQEPHIYQGDLQRLLDIPLMSGALESYTEQTNQDLANALRSKHQFELAGQELPELITKSSQFRQWLVNPGSRELLIHGNRSSEPTSPLTLFCSLLIKNLISMDRFRTVFFFCGSHTRSTHYDPYSGGASMIKSFLAQLLSQNQFDLKFLSLGDIEQIKANNLEALRWLFKTLVQHLDREVTLFCIIDGIDFYCDHHGPHFEDMQLVVESCLELREATDMRATFKLLISCSSSTELSKYARGDCFLNLTPGERTGIEFSSSRFEREFGNEFSERYY
ncbi:hypothetical protein H4I95_02909 [Botrytis cinerea]